MYWEKKALAKNYCYWKGIDFDIENIVRSCQLCCGDKKDSVLAPIQKWKRQTKIRNE